MKTPLECLAALQEQIGATRDGNDLSPILDGLGKYLRNESPAERQIILADIAMHATDASNVQFKRAMGPRAIEGDKG